MWIRLLSEVDGHRVGHIIDVADTRGRELVAASLAEEEATPVSAAAAAGDDADASDAAPESAPADMAQKGRGGRKKKAAVPGEPLSGDPVAGDPA